MHYPDKWLPVRVKLQRTVCAPLLIYKPEIHFFPDPWLLSALIILEKRRVGRGSLDGGRKKTEGESGLGNKKIPLTRQ
jgi:hypothetical protein